MEEEEDEEEEDDADTEEEEEGGGSEATDSSNAGGASAPSAADAAAAVTVLSRADVNALLPLLLQRSTATAAANGKNCGDVMPATAAAMSAWKAASSPLSVVQVRICLFSPPVQS
jgi:hypothetical protein